MKVIDVNTLRNLQQEGVAFCLLNVLPPEQFKSSHIEGSENVCIYELAFNKKVEEELDDQTVPVIVYGLNNDYFAAQKAAERLESLGFSDISVLDGGLDAWLHAGYPTIKAEEQAHACSVKNHAITLDPEKCKVRWTGRNLANSHWGYLSVKDGNVLVQDDLLVDGEICLDMTTLSCSDLTPESGSEGLIGHLFSNDFFAVDRFPVANVKVLSSSKIEKATWGKPNYVVKCEFDIRGNKQKIEFEALIGYTGACKFVAQAQIKLDRTLFGSQYGSGKFFEFLGKHMVADLFELEITLVEK